MECFGMMSAGLLERLAGFAPAVVSQTSGPECWIWHFLLNPPPHPPSFSFPFCSKIGRTRFVYAEFHVLFDTICIQFFVQKSLVSLRRPCRWWMTDHGNVWMNLSEICPGMSLCNSYILLIYLKILTLLTYLNNSAHQEHKDKKKLSIKNKNFP